MLEPIIDILISVVYGSDNAVAVTSDSTLMFVFATVSLALVMLTVTFVFKFILKLVDR